MLRFIHAADFHLDSTFAALTPRQAAARRRESRELPVRLANYVNQNNIDLVLLAGDLFDTPPPTGTRQRNSPPLWGRWRHRSTSPPATMTGTAPAAPT